MASGDSRDAGGPGGLDADKESEDEDSRTRQDFDVFISYAHADDSDGLISQIRQWIDQDARDPDKGFRPLTVFFDTRDIKDSQDWSQRIAKGLRTSRIMIVLTSPNYYESEWCQKEFDTFRVSLSQKLIDLVSVEGSDDRGPVTPLFLFDVDVAELPREKHQWFEMIQQIQGIDLRRFFGAGSEQLTQQSLREQIRQFGRSLAERILKAEHETSVPGNLLTRNPRFVGRDSHLRELHNLQFGMSSAKSAVVVHGQGGMGKTELVVQYANMHPGDYRGGSWWVRAEGQTNLLSALAQLADDPNLFGPDQQRMQRDPETDGKAVLYELQRRTRETNSNVLLILDNVSHPGALSSHTMRLLPSDGRVRIVATSRLGANEFGDHVATLEVGGLTESEGLELIRQYQPLRQGIGDFVNEDEEVAAREIVAQLDGFTLAIEQVALHLGMRGAAEYLPSQMLKAFRQLGLAETGSRLEAAQPDERGELFQSRAIGSVLETTWSNLGNVERTALEFASLLPPDTIPWHWVEQLTATAHPEAFVEDLFEGEPPWAASRRRLDGRRLLTSTSNTSLARMHRLVSAALRGTVAPEKADMVQEFLGHQAERMETGDGLEPWEVEVLTEALLMFASDDPDFAFQLGDQTFERINSPSLFEGLNNFLGDGRPLKLAQRVCAHFEGRVAQQPRDWDLQRALADAMTSVGELLVDSEPRSALAMHQRSLALVQALAEARPGVIEAQHRLVDAYRNVGFVYEAEDWDSSRSYYERGLEVAERIAGLQPDDLDAQLDVVLLVTEVASAIWTKDVRRSEDLLQWVCDISQRVADHRPGDTQALGLLSYSYSLLAVLFHDAEEEYPARTPGMGERSLEMALRSLEVAEQLANHEGGYDVHEAVPRVACVLRQHEPELVINSYEHLLERREAEAASKPGDLQCQRQFGHALTSRAKELEGSEPGRALALHRRALELTDELIEKWPSNRYLQRDLLHPLAGVGRLMRAEDHGQALQAFTRRREVADDILRSWPEDQFAMEGLHAALVDLAGLLQQSDPQQAAELEARAASIGERLSE